MNQAKQDFIDGIMEASGCDELEAEEAYELYVTERRIEQEYKSGLL